MCSVTLRCSFQMDAALQLVRPGPATRPLLLVRRGRPRARDAADRTVTRLVQWVVGNLVHLDVRPDPLLVPIGERVELPRLVARRPVDLRRARAARRLVAADSGDPRVVGLERTQERLDLADATAAVGIALPQVRPLGAMLLRNRRDRGLDQLDPVA